MYITQYKGLFIFMGLFPPPINVKINYDYWTGKASKDSVLFTDLCSLSSHGSCLLSVPAAHNVFLCWQLSLLMMTNLRRALWLFQDRLCFHWTPIDLFTHMSGTSHLYSSLFSTKMVFSAAPLFCWSGCNRILQSRSNENIALAWSPGWGQEVTAVKITAVFKNTGE